MNWNSSSNNNHNNISSFHHGDEWNCNEIAQKILALSKTPELTSIPTVARLVFHKISPSDWRKVSIFWLRNGSWIGQRAFQASKPASQWVKQAASAVRGPRSHISRWDSGAQTQAGRQSQRHRRKYSELDSIRRAKQKQKHTFKFIPANFFKNKLNQNLQSRNYYFE